MRNAAWGVCCSGWSSGAGGVSTRWDGMQEWVQDRSQSEHQVQDGILENKAKLVNYLESPFNFIRLEHFGIDQVEQFQIDHFKGFQK